MDSAEIREEVITFLISFIISWMGLDGWAGALTQETHCFNEKVYSA